MTIVTWNIIRACRGPNVGYSSGLDFSEENTELTYGGSKDNRNARQLKQQGQRS